VRQRKRLLTISTSPLTNFNHPAESPSSNTGTTEQSFVKAIAKKFTILWPAALVAKILNWIIFGISSEGTVAASWPTKLEV